MTDSPVTVAAVQAKMPLLPISDSTRPSTEDVTRYIDQYTAEVRALVTSAGGVWPADSTGDVAAFLTQTILEGVTYEALRARWMLQRGGQLPDEVQFARDAYRDRIRQVGALARGMQAAETSGEAGYSFPVALAERDAPTLAGSFFTWTRAVDRRSRRATHWSPFTRGGV